MTGTRNRAFEDDETPPRKEIEEIPSVSKQTSTDGAQLTRFVSFLIIQELKN
jgi:hypothetical protein